jgi:hypothetical protein
MAKPIPAFMLKGREGDMAMASMQGDAIKSLEDAKKDKILREKRETAKIWIKDLQKFYISPYLTCGECNTVCFINAVQLEKALERNTVVFDDLSAEDQKEYSEASLNIEALPPCPGCNRTYKFLVGAHDLSAIINMDKKAQAERKRQEFLASRLLQARIRGIFARKDAKRRAKAKALYARLLNRAATIIQTHYRGHRARIVAITERALDLIDKAHPRLLKTAMFNKFGYKKVFYFKKRTEQKLLHDNYRVLIERLGNRPQMYQVEWSMQEIARRIFRLQCNFAIRIQKLVRGVIGRNFIRYFRMERARLTRIQTKGVFAIQRTYRGWFFRERSKAHKLSKWKDEMRKKYKKERLQKKATKSKREAREMLMKRYKKEKREERSARMTGKTVYGEEGGKQMLAFSKSAYADTKLQDQTRSWLRGRRREKLGEVRGMAKRFARHRFIQKKEEQDSIFAGYYKPEKDDRRQEFMGRIEALKARFSVIGPGKSYKDLIK